MISRIGQQFGDYRLIQFLGQGTFGEVYLGMHVYERAHAAIKVLKTRLTDPGDLREFVNEARTFRLRHPHIIQLLDFGINDDGVPFLVVNYAPNGTLRHRHPTRTRLPLPTVVSYVKQIASALQYAHEHRIVHRDVKPENMLIGSNGEVLLSDFGIAAVAHSTQSLSTQNEAGTIPYMAPEQIRGKPRPASDQYSLGVIVYEWLSGTRPFVGSSAIEIAMHHLSDPPTPLHQKIAEIPPAVEQVVLKALAKDPQQRFPSIQTFSDALEQASTPQGPAMGMRPSRQKRSLERIGLPVVTCTDPGSKNRYKPNEDSLFAAQGTREANASLQQVGLFVVADGIGDRGNGQDASCLAIQTMINYILPKLVHNGEVTGSAFQQLLIDGVQCANQAVHQRNMEQRTDMRTMMTAALIVVPIGVTYVEEAIRPPTAVGYIANVGDSRTYLYRQGRGLVKLTNDHSVVADLVEAGIIRPDDIYTHPKRNQIYRSLGEKPAVEVDSFVVALKVDDKLLLCSDGLWHMVRDPQIEAVLKHPDSPTMAGDALLQAALNGGGEDNISMIVVQIPDPNKLNARLGIQLIDKPEVVQMPQL